MTIMNAYNALWESALFFIPLVTFCALIATLIGVTLAYTSKELQSARYILTQSLYIFSFVVFGFIAGCIIRLSGGFSSEQSDPFSSLATLVTLLTSIVVLFLGESKLETSSGVKPIGTATAVLTLLVGYFYTTEYLAMLSMNISQ